MGVEKPKIAVDLSNGEWYNVPFAFFFGESSEQTFRWVQVLVYKGIIAINMFGFVLERDVFFVSSFVL
jgi:hypothetical protein